ncbi:MAG: hypothetical protein AAFQ43_08430, partial [Bacteroidota bacterium]
MRRFVPLAGLLCFFASEPFAQTPFTVTTAANDGPGSLRQAILDANAASGATRITFDISGTGPHTIQPQTPLPEIGDSVAIDATTQPGASCE